MSLHPLATTFPTTVAALHRVAEDVVAPARKSDDEIALRRRPAASASVFGYAGLSQQVCVEGAEFVRRADGEERRVAPRTVEAAR